MIAKILYWTQCLVIFSNETHTRNSMIVIVARINREEEYRAELISCRSAEPIKTIFRVVVPQDNGCYPAAISGQAISRVSEKRIQLTQYAPVWRPAKWNRKITWPDKGCASCPCRDRENVLRVTPLIQRFDTVV